MKYPINTYKVTITDKEGIVLDSVTAYGDESDLASALDSSCPDLLVCEPHEFSSHDDSRFLDCEECGEPKDHPVHYRQGDAHSLYPTQQGVRRTGLQG